MRSILLTKSIILNKEFEQFSVGGREAILYILEENNCDSLDKYYLAENRNLCICFRMGDFVLQAKYKSESEEQFLSIRDCFYFFVDFIKLYEEIDDNLIIDLLLVKIDYRFKYKEGKIFQCIPYLKGDVSVIYMIAIDENGNNLYENHVEFILKDDMVILHLVKDEGLRDNEAHYLAIEYVKELSAILSQYKISNKEKTNE